MKLSSPGAQSKCPSSTSIRWGQVVARWRIWILVAPCAWGPRALALTLGAVVTALIALPLVRNHEKTDPAERLYRKLCDELSRSGLPRAAHEGPLAYRTRLRDAALPPARQRAALAFLELYESLRYGMQDPTNTQGARAALKQLKSLLKHSR